MCELRSDVTTPQIVQVLKANFSSNIAYSQKFHQLLNVTTFENV